MWQEELRLALRTTEDLVKAGLIAPEEQGPLEGILSQYQFLLPRYYASLIDKENPACPIRLQAIPHLLEEKNAPGFVADPLQDLAHQPKERLTHRFHGRVLLHLSPNCSMYCRFCFRKTLLNELKPDLFSGSLDDALEYVEAHPEIEEVIFSGGDPFMASDAVIAQVMEQIRKIPTIQRLRFHTRVPVTLPMRVTDYLLHAILKAEKPVVVVTHFNHPKEITEDSKSAAQLMRNKGLTLLNQSVLLNGVNDSFQTLAVLSQKLFSVGILPYYLHQLDSSQGTQHFLVPREKGKAIHEKLKTTLSGFLVPRYVEDTVGAPYKRDV